MTPEEEQGYGFYAAMTIILSVIILFVVVCTSFIQKFSTKPDYNAYSITLKNQHGDPHE